MNHARNQAFRLLKFSTDFLRTSDPFFESQLGNEAGTTFHSEDGIELLQSIPSTLQPIVDSGLAIIQTYSFRDKDVISEQHGIIRVFRAHLDHVRFTNDLMQSRYGVLFDPQGLADWKVQLKKYDHQSKTINDRMVTVLSILPESEQYILPKDHVFVINGIAASKLATNALLAFMNPTVQAGSKEELVVKLLNKATIFAKQTNIPHRILFGTVGHHCLGVDDNGDVRYALLRPSRLKPLFSIDVDGEITLAKHTGIKPAKEEGTTPPH